MKGAAMKIGQVASFVDTGALPKEAHERLEEKLAKLRDSAPRVSFEQMRKVIESDMGQPLEEVFAEFEPEAFAAASIGQVYRARLHDGRRVAVKVQYPGIANAVRADVQNLGPAPARGEDARARAWTRRRWRRRSASASPRSWTTRSRRRRTARSRARGAGIRSS